MNDRRINSIEERLARLEKAVFDKKSKRFNLKSAEDDFSGASGGVRFLITKNFFNLKRTRAQIRSELAKNGYHYSGPAVQMACKRLSKRSGPLAAFTEGGKKVYVRRK
jgi:hypothetical protein